MNKYRPVALYDRWLLAAAVSLAVLGLLMVYSSSVVISHKVYGHPFHYLFRHGAYLTLGIILLIGALRVNTSTWQMSGPILLLISIMMLIAVLIPGLGHQVNGSMRWIGVGPLTMQASELTKFAFIVYLAGYLVRRDEEVKTRLSGFIKPLIVLSVITALLLREPDFGAAAVMIITALGMLFLAGVRWWQFGALFIFACGALISLAISSPYRIARLTSFLNPWADQFDKGYQLTQSLIAFGRGGWTGLGLGESIQKLFYLPEAHTDFLFAVIAEELGLLGVLAVVTLFVIVVFRALTIARKAHMEGKLFNAYVSYGFALWIALQTLINMGVSSGLLPTKGLTLPFLSYGGNSLIFMCIVLAILLRIDYELRVDYYGLSRNDS